MQALKNIGIDYRVTALFGITALLLSLLTGIMSGISGGVVAVRSLVLTLVFSLLGYGIVFIVKKFVPEVYQMISDRTEGLDLDVVPESKAGDADAPSIIETADAGVAVDDYASAGAGGDEGESGVTGSGVQEGGFSEFRDNDFPRMKSGSSTDSGLNVTLNTSEQKKYGKHILVKDEFVRYEPKLMAEAVRTMMSKDED